MELLLVLWFFPLSVALLRLSHHAEHWADHGGTK